MKLQNSFVRIKLLLFAVKPVRVKPPSYPKYVCPSDGGCAGFIGHTQPRRIAARTVANRIVEELGETMGQSVGYKS